MASDLPPDTSAASAPAAQVAPAARAASQIHVDSNGYHYVVNGNRLLSEAVVSAALESGTTPKDAIEKLNAAYQAAGYFMVVIGGEVSNKLVALTVLQGRITESDVSPELEPYFRGLSDRDDLQRSSVIRSSLQAEQYLARQGLRPRVSFAKAEEVGGTKLIVAEEPVPDTKPWSANLTFGNLGSRFSSRYLAGANGTLRPGAGVELTGAYSQGIPGLTSDSAGSQYQSAAAGVSVVTPWGTYGGTWQGISYKIGQSAAPLYPVGDINQAAITGSQLVYADEVTRINLTQSFNYNDNIQTVFDGAFLLTDQHYGYFTLGASYAKQFAVLGQSATFLGSVTGLQGMSRRSGTFLPPDPGIPNPRFGILQASANYFQSLPAGFSAALNLSGQYADTTVPQNQQWVVGGFGNLTAWLPAVLVGDSGALGRLNLQTPGLAWNGYGVSGSAFVEAGLVRLHLTPLGNPKTRTLADSGLSVTGTTPFGTTAAIAYAWPIASRNVDIDALNRQSRANLYFTLSQAF